MEDLDSSDGPGLDVYDQGSQNHIVTILWTFDAVRDQLKTILDHEDETLHFGVLIE